MGTHDSRRRDGARSPPGSSASLLLIVVVFACSMSSCSGRSSKRQRQAQKHPEPGHDRHAGPHHARASTAPSSMATTATSCSRSRPVCEIKMLRQAIVAVVPDDEPRRPPADDAGLRGARPRTAADDEPVGGQTTEDPQRPEHLAGAAADRAERQGIVAPRSTPNSQPGRYLAALVVLIVVMLLGVLGGAHRSARRLAQELQGRPRPGPVQRHLGHPAGGQPQERRRRRARRR